MIANSRLRHKELIRSCLTILPKSSAKVQHPCGSASCKTIFSIYMPPAGVCLGLHTTQSQNALLVNVGSVHWMQQFFVEDMVLAEFKRN